MLFKLFAKAKTLEHKSLLPYDFEGSLTTPRNFQAFRW